MSQARMDVGYLTTPTTSPIKARAKFKGDTEALARFKGEFPAFVQRLMNGEGVLPDVGFNKLAVQLAIAANVLSKTEKQLVEACEGLVQNHFSDSSRYNSPRKRKESAVARKFSENLHIIGLLIRDEVRTKVPAHEQLTMYFWLHGGYMEP